MKEMGATAAAGVSGHAMSVSAETGRHRTYSVSYPATRPPTELMTTSVLLEMGVRGGSHPHELVPIGSLLSDVLIDAGTELGADDTVRPPSRSGRHFYDVFQLLGDDRILHLLADRVQVMEVIESIDQITHRYFAGSAGTSTRPPEGFASSPAFDLANSVSARLQQSYQSTMPELHYGSEPLPTWDAICERVCAHAALL